jgi:hypothetical protein
MGKMLWSEVLGIEEAVNIPIPHTLRMPLRRITDPE